MEKNDLIPENNNVETNPAEAQENHEDMRKTSTTNVDFAADDTITVVAAAPEEKNKKLPVIIAACVVAVVVIVAAVIFFVNSGDKKGEEATTNPVYIHGNDEFNDFLNEAMTEEMTDVSGNVISREEYVENIKQQVQEATTTLSDDVGKISPNQIVENTTTAEGGNVQTENAEQVQKADAQIKAFFNRACYIQGAMYSQASGDPLAMSFDGDNFEILTNLDGTEVSIMNIEGTMYIKRPATKQYVELTDTVMEMMGLEGDTFNLSFSTADYETMQTKLRSTYDVKINGESGICHEYVSDDQIFKFYSVDGQLKQIDTCDLTGVANTQIIINYFSESIPADQMTLKGYAKSSIGAIFADMM